MEKDLSKKNLTELEHFYEKLERRLELKLRSKQLLSEAIHWMNVRGEQINERRSKQWQKILAEVEELEKTKLEVLRLLDEKSALVRAQEQPGFRRSHRGGRDEPAGADPERFRRWAFRAAAAGVPLAVVCAAVLYFLTRSPVQHPAVPLVTGPAVVKQPAPVERPAAAFPAVVQSPASIGHTTAVVPPVVKPPVSADRPAAVPTAPTAGQSPAASPRVTKASHSDMELAAASLKRKQYRRAEELYLKVIRNQPDHVEAAMALGDLYLETGQYERAKAMFDSVAQRVEKGEAVAP